MREGSEDGGTHGIVRGKRMLWRSVIGRRKAEGKRK